MAHVTHYLFRTDLEGPINDMLPRTARFLAVGIVGTLVDLSLFAILNIRIGLPTLTANTLSYSAGIVNNYVLHRHWTFGDRSRQAIGAQFFRFALVSLSALVLNTLLVLFLTPRFETLFADATRAAVLAKICATGAGLGWNFLVSHFWIFREVNREAQS